VRTASIIRAMIVLMMEAVRTSEKSVIFNVTTRQYISEDSKLHNRRRENLKSHDNEVINWRTGVVTENSRFLIE
jgi:hypothetical protein